MRLPGTQKSFVMNTMQVFYKTVPAKSSSSFSGCQQEIISSTLGHGHSGTYKTIHEPLSCRQTRMLAETGPRELRRKVMPQLYTDWSESMEYLSKEYQEFVTDRVIHHFNTLLLLWLLRSHHTPHTTLKWRQTWMENLISQLYRSKWSPLSLLLQDCQQQRALFAIRTFLFMERQLFFNIILITISC